MKLRDHDQLCEHGFAGPHDDLRPKCPGGRGRTNRMSGAERIAAERQRQIEQEGWSANHDQRHTSDALARAACVYAAPAWCRGRILADWWPWTDTCWKPTPNNRIRELEKAGALIAAEIDRLINLLEGPTE